MVSWFWKQCTSCLHPSPCADFIMMVLKREIRLPIRDSVRALRCICLLGANFFSLTPSVTRSSAGSLKLPPTAITVTGDGGVSLKFSVLGTRSIRAGSKHLGSAIRLWVTHSSAKRSIMGCQRSLPITSVSAQ